MTTRIATRKIVITGILMAVTIVLGMTPMGLIPIPPIYATTLHIPLLIAVMLEGPLVGTLLGVGFGLFSMYNAMTTPTPTSFIFMNPLVALLPRLLITPAAYFVNKWLQKALRGRARHLSIPIAAIVGSLTNTVGVLGMIYLRYGAQYAAAIGIDPSAALGALGGIALTQGLPEAALSAMIVTPTVKAISKIFGKNT